MKCGFFLLITTVALTILNLPCFASGDSVERKLLAHEPDAELTQMGVTRLICTLGMTRVLI